MGLPAPYDTHCFDYSRKGYESQVGCTNECLKDTAISKMSMIHPEALTL